MRGMRKRRRSALEVSACEPRLALSAITGIANTIQLASGVVARPGEVAPVRTALRPTDFSAGRTKTLIGFQVQAGPAGRLAPVVASANGPGGGALRFRPGAIRVQDGLPQTTAYLQARQPGALTVGVAGAHGTTGPFDARSFRIGDLTGDGKVDLNDEVAFQPAYLSHVGDGFYNPAADANNDGFIGQTDAVALLHNLTPPTRPIPQNVLIFLAPQDRLPGHTVQKNSGGFTSKSDVTILIRTTPGSLIFADSGLGDYSFTGPVFFADADGYARIRQHLPENLVNTEFRIMDPFGHHVVRAFPIRRFDL